MKESHRIGIIDIGSNSIRLVIYEITPYGGYYLIDESKASARLSQRIESDGSISDGEVKNIVNILQHFQQLCESNQTDQIRAIATAAIRNCSNSSDVLQKLVLHTGLSIEIVSGYDEARLGLVGALNSIDIQNGFLLDIGGGSTEITLVLSRAIQHTISIPFGSVNLTKQIISKKENMFLDVHFEKISKLIEKTLKKEKWMMKYPGLPLIGFGGTMRTIAKVHQKQIKYSLNRIHNYALNPIDIEQLFHKLIQLPTVKRKNVEGLSSDRVDTILPGMCIYLIIAKMTNPSQVIFSEAGLRDGALYESISPQKPMIDHIVDHSVKNLLSLHPAVPIKHVLQVKKLSLELFRAMEKKFTAQRMDQLELYLSIAALCYRIGVTISYYDYPQHTYYLMINSRLHGLTHREILVSSMIASYKNKTTTKQIYMEHTDILKDSDLLFIVQLGSILKLAIALDRSETQPIVKMNAFTEQQTIVLELHVRHACTIELNEIKEVEKDYRKQMGVKIKINLISTIE